MRVVSDTSPVSNLAIIGRLDLLRRLYGEVSIAPSVAEELSRLYHARGGWPWQSVRIERRAK